MESAIMSHWYDEWMITEMKNEIVLFTDEEKNIEVQVNRG